MSRLHWIAIQLLPIMTALCAATALAMLIGLALDVNPGELLRLLGSRFGPYAWGQVLFRATFLTFTGLLHKGHDL